MNTTFNGNAQSEKPINYCYHMLIDLKGASCSRSDIQQIVNKFQHLGLYYSLNEDKVTMLSYRSRNNSKILECLSNLAQVLPSENCYRLEALCHDPELDFGFLLYKGIVYRLESLAHPRKPQRLVVGRRAVA